MSTLRKYYDIGIIGGGFYGCCLALTLAERFRHVVVLEREDDLLKRASYANQARVHNGYHYPRSLLTASRSAINYPRFLKEFDGCIDRTFLKVYAIARNTSKVTAYQFLKFCGRVGIPARRTPPAIARLFNETLIEDTFITEECAFDAVQLRQLLRRKMEAAGVEVVCNEQVESIERGGRARIQLNLASGCGIAADSVLNCTYAKINELLVRSSLPKLPLKHELTELALIQMPPELEKVGITVMDGPFFSSMPFPALGLHTLSHVTYTPHASWKDSLEEPLKFPTLPPSKYIFMLRDATRYVPSLKNAVYKHSHFEMKTVLLQNEVDDGRPILCRHDYGMPGLSVVLGAKIDNIYDVVQSVENQFQALEAIHGNN
jgi:glycine/D-amino acid oxidase-like deaminating enzyme